MPPAETADSFMGYQLHANTTVCWRKCRLECRCDRRRSLRPCRTLCIPAEGQRAWRQRRSATRTQQSTAQLHHFLCSKDQNTCLSHPFLVKLGMACGLWFTQQPRHLKRFLMCLSWNEWYAPDILDSLQNVYFSFLKWGGPWNKSFNIFSEPPRHGEWLDIGSPCFALLKRRPPAEPLRTFGRSQLCSPHGISSLPALENDDFW
jgi:hypothetical protein